MHRIAYKTWTQHRLARQRGDIETNNTTAHPQQGTAETGITTATEKCTKNARFSHAKAMTVSIPHRHTRAKATPVSNNRAAWSTGPGRGARVGFEARCRRDWLAWLRRPWAAAGPGRASTATQRRRCGGRRRDRRARAGFDIDHSKPQARVWRSRGRPGPTAPGTPVGQQATPTPQPHTKTPTRNRVGVSEPPVGIEPTTYSLRVKRSAD